MGRSSGQTARATDHDLPWYRQAFEARYLDLYAHRNEEDAARAIAFVDALLRESPVEGMRRPLRILDLCCGAGRHLEQLADPAGSFRHPISLAVGLDLSQPLLHRAKDRLAIDGFDCAGPRACVVVRGDMRHLPFPDGNFDLVLNLFTSLGYFEDESENLRVFEEIARVLRPGGLFVLDHINLPYLERTLEPETRRELPDGSVITERRRLDRDRGRVIKEIHWQDAGHAKVEWEESVRVYDAHELSARFDSLNLHQLRTHGDYETSALHADSPRMIFVLRAR